MNRQQASGTVGTARGTGRAQPPRDAEEDSCCSLGTSSARACASGKAFTSMAHLGCLVNRTPVLICNDDEQQRIEWFDMSYAHTERDLLSSTARMGTDGRSGGQVLRRLFGLRTTYGKLGDLVRQERVADACAQDRAPRGLTLTRPPGWPSPMIVSQPSQPRWCQERGRLQQGQTVRKNECDSHGSRRLGVSQSNMFMCRATG